MNISSIEPHYDALHCELDRKIDRQENRLLDLQRRLPHRKTHGGKRFRAKRGWLQKEIEETVNRISALRLLQERSHRKPTLDHLACGDPVLVESDSSDSEDDFL